MTLQKPCLNCGKIIEKTSTTSLKNWAERVKYCGRSCLMKYRKRVMKMGVDTQFKKGNKAINPIKPGQRLSPKTEFKKGHTPWHKGTKGLKPAWNVGIEHTKVRGEKHWNWKGGKTPLHQKIRSLVLYKKWRRAVYDKCKNTCVLCGATKSEKRLHTDHIYPFSEILLEYNIQSIQDAKACEALWDVENGRVLCIDCDRASDTYLHKQWKRIHAKKTTNAKEEERGRGCTSHKKDNECSEAKGCCEEESYSKG